MPLSRYNAKVIVICQNDEEAKQVQRAVDNITAGTQLMGADLLQFYAFYKPNEAALKPVFKDVFKSKSIGELTLNIAKHGKTLLTLKK